MADLKPIRSESDYEEALKELKRLWGAKSGTLEGDRLDVLATLIDAYETNHDPMDPPDPVEAIKFRREQQGLSADPDVVTDSKPRIARTPNHRPSLSIDVIRRLRSRLGSATDVLCHPIPDESAGLGIPRNNPRESQL